MKNEQVKKLELNYSALIETVFAVVIGQNAIMLSKPIIAFGTYNISFIVFVSFLSIGLINLLTITANWLSSKKTESYYNGILFLSDIGTLAIFAVFTQVLTDCFKDEELLFDKSIWLLTFSISYFLIYLTFIIWNFTVRSRESGAIRKNFSIAIVMNLIILISLIPIIVSVFIDLEIIQYQFFFLNIILQLIVLAFYYIVAFISPRNKSHIRQKAQWIGSPCRYIKQTAISILSFIRRPFVREKPGAVREYWKGYYSGAIIDNFVFDSSDIKYLDKIEHVIQVIGDISKTDVIDLCSGNGNLYKWLVMKHHMINSYLGVDFSIDTVSLSENANIQNANIGSYEYKIGDDSMVFVINGLCYCNAHTVDQVIKKIQNVKTIVIIEPIPGIFWDACFKGVILHYRGKKKLSKILKPYGFSLKFHITDYTFKIFGLFIQPMSRAYLFLKD